MEEMSTPADADRPLRVLIVSQYFWPENFRINDLASSLSDRGHQVTVLTGLPNYPEGDLHPDFHANPGGFLRFGQVDVVRVVHALRGKSKARLALNYLTFFLNASLAGPWKLRGKTFDVIFVFAVSPITMAIPAIVLGKLRRIPVFLWIQDLWPETLQAVGVLRSARLLTWVGVMVSWIYRHCDHLLVQSRAFLPSVRKYCAAADQRGKVLYFPNWAEQVFHQADVAQQTVIQREPGKFTVLFAGNVGDAQDFPAVLAAAKSIRSAAHIRWVIVGDGRMHARVAEMIRQDGLEQSVHLVGRFPLEMMPGFFEVADVMLVSLKADDIFSRTIPAKVQSYMAAGKPILCMVDGEARQIIDESGSGMSCAAGDAQQLGQLALEMSRMTPDELAAMGQNGLNYYLRHFEREFLVSRLESYFRSALAGVTPDDGM